MKKTKKSKEAYYTKYIQYLQSKTEFTFEEEKQYLTKYNLFENITDVMPCAMYLLDYQHQKYRFVSPEIFDITKYSPENLLEQGYEWYLDQLHPHDFDEFTETIFENFVKYVRSMAHKNIKNAQFSLNYRFKTNEGKYIQLLDQYIVLEVDDEHKPVLVLGILSDITIRKADNKMIFSITTSDKNHSVKVEQIKSFPNNISFTKRQKQIIGLIKMGHSSKEIAENLKISVHTVHAHRSKLLEKFNCKNTSELLNIYHLDL